MTNYLYRHRVVALTALLLLTILASCWSLFSGEIQITPGNFLSILNHPESMEYAVLNNMRIPRLMLAFSVGGALSLVGAVLQGIFRNPLVEPYTLGISGGASFAVALSIVLGLSAGSFPGLALSGFAGATTVLLLVYFLSVQKGMGNINRVLLTGVMISFVCSSGLMFLLGVASNDELHNILFWTMGSLDQSDPKLIKLVFFSSIASLLIVNLFAQPLNALRLGKEHATHLGVHASLLIRFLFIITSLITGICVSVTGIIGFVGLVIPHLIRLIMGPDFRFLLTGAFLGGGFFLIVCDVLAKTLMAPNELPVGVLTGITGGIMFVVVLGRSEYKKGRMR